MARKPIVLLLNFYSFLLYFTAHCGTLKQYRNKIKNKVGCWVNHIHMDPLHPTCLQNKAQSLCSKRERVGVFSLEEYSISYIVYNSKRKVWWLGTRGEWVRKIHCIHCYSVCIVIIWNFPENLHTINMKISNTKNTVLIKHLIFWWQLLWLMTNWVKYENIIGDLHLLFLKMFLCLSYI